MILTEKGSNKPPLFPGASFTRDSSVTGTFFFVVAKSGKAVGGFNGDSKSNTLIVNLDCKQRSLGVVIVDGHTYTSNSYKPLTFVTKVYLPLLFALNFGKESEGFPGIAAFKV